MWKQLMRLLMNFDKRDLSNAYDQYIDENEPVAKERTLNDKVLVVDGLNTFIRAFSVNPALNEDGVHIGGLIGFLKSIRHAINKINPTRCVIVFDGKDGSKSRRKIYPQYKAQRKVKSRLNRNVDWSTTPVDEQAAMAQQISRLVNYLEQLPVKILSLDGTEADDVMAYLAVTIFKKDVTLMSTDKDFLHLVNERIAVWSPTKSKMYDEQAVKDEFGVIPQNLLTWRTLDGDKSDNIAGIRGAGLKTVKKCFPEITEDKLFTVKDLIDTYSGVDHKYKLQESVLKNVDTIKRNYLLMQLYNVDIGNRKKLMLQNSFASNAETLVKFEFQKMFIKDKLWGSIPNLDSWMLEFVRLNNFLKKETNEQTK